MKDWPPMHPDIDPDMALANDLLDKADALLRRHRSPDGNDDGGSGFDEVIVALEDGDDLPILTDIVDADAVAQDRAIPVLTEIAPVVAAPAPPATGIDPARVAEHFIEIDTEISREIETWFANELPPILARELDALVDKVRVETIAQLRATLLPQISEHIVRRLDQINPPKSPKP